MKIIEEIDMALDSDQLKNATRISFQSLTRQALEWARQIIIDHPRTAERRIRRRIEALEELQTGKEIMGPFTKPARANQIKALRWVIDEGDLDALDPLY